MCPTTSQNLPCSKSKIFQSVMDAAKQCLINRLTFLYLISVMVSFLFCWTDPLFGRKRPLAFLLVFMWHLLLLQKLRFLHNVTSFFSKSSQHHASVDANVDSLTCSLVLIDFNQVLLVIYSHIDWFYSILVALYIWNLKFFRWVPNSKPISTLLFHSHIRQLFYWAQLLPQMDIITNSWGLWLKS